MLGFLKKCGHFALGCAAGYGAVDRPLIALNASIMFLGYQRLEQVREGDEGYHEAFQYAAGFGFGLAARGAKALWRWYRHGGADCTAADPCDYCPEAQAALRQKRRAAVNL